MSRIAAGSPALWRDIAMANRHHLARVLGVFMEDLAEFRRSLADGNASEIEEFFAKAKQRRDSWHTPEKSGLKGE
jgi:prephenate dehydrogenase